jgi:hypothetical protein
MSAIECSCEGVARGPCGLIASDEVLARLLFFPDHIRKSDQSVKPGAFPLSHIQEKGLSLVRPNKLSVKELEIFAKAVACSKGDRKWHGQIEFVTGVPRSLTDDDGNRSVCVFEDPTNEECGVPANPAHTLLISARHPMTEADAKEVRAALVINGVLKLAVS